MSRRSNNRNLDPQARDALDAEALDLAADYSVSEARAFRALQRSRNRPAPGRVSTAQLSYDPGAYAGTPGPAVMRKATSNDVAADAETQLRRAARSSGRPLPASLRSRLETDLRADLSDVRVHTGEASAAAAASVGARAYARGLEIHFATGEFDPQSQSGQRLVAHEVAHTVQQRGVTGARQDKLEVSQPGDALERQADAFADAFVAGGAAVAVRRSAPRGRGGRHVESGGPEPPSRFGSRRWAGIATSTADNVRAAQPASKGYMRQIVSSCAAVVCCAMFNSSSSLSAVATRVIARSLE